MRSGRASACLVPAGSESPSSRLRNLYDTLLKIGPSPVVELNRAIAVSQSEGVERGLEEINRIADLDRLASYPFYPATRGELELRRGQPEAARRHFRDALSLARNPMERHFLRQRLAACEPGSNEEKASHQ